MTSIAHTPTTTFIETFEAADATAVDTLGGKGAGLARMTQQGLRVPPGFIVTTAACRSYLTNNRVPESLRGEIDTHLSDLEVRSDKSFGRGPTPLLLSVRSGAPVSMPGMMDTILNLGLDRDAAIALAKASGDTRFMAELVARFHEMYSEIVLGALDADNGVRPILDRIEPDDPPGPAYDRVWRTCQQALDDETGASVPSDPRAQLFGAVEAVFRSWNTRRARTYREFHGIPDDLGTAVVVQSMVFGNTGADSGSGVVFTRNPITGEPGLFGEYLAASQGEDVVAGTRTPAPVAEALAPDVLTELATICADLEASHRDVLDIEFTVERSALYLLQVRSAKRTPEAAVRIASDLLAEQVISPPEALQYVSADQIRQVQRPGFDVDDVHAARAAGRLLTTGIGACPGQVCGELIVDPDRAKTASEEGRKVILARSITSPADLHGMIASEGIVTATGGSTSHAAVVARALATACVVGAGDLRIDHEAQSVSVNGVTLREGDLISLDGATGELFLGEFATATPAGTTTALSALLDAATEAVSGEVFGRVTVSHDVDTLIAAHAAGIAVEVGKVLAAGGHLAEVQQYLLDDDAANAADVVARCFTPILAATNGCPVIVRALDLLSADLAELVDASTSPPHVQEMTLPLGSSALIAAQVEGLTRAVRESKSTSPVQFAVCRISDPAEARALAQAVGGSGGALSAGAQLTNPRGLATMTEIAAHADVWVDLHALQAAVNGLPQSYLLSAQPLDDYLARGLMGTDPRRSIDSTTVAMLESAATSSDGALGVDVAGTMSSEIAETLYALGIARVIVDADEVRPTLVALGQASGVV